MEGDLGQQRIEAFRKVAVERTSVPVHLEVSLIEATPLGAPAELSEPWRSYSSSSWRDW